MAPVSRDPIRCVCCRTTQRGRKGDRHPQFHSLTNIRENVLEKVNKQIQFVNRRKGKAHPLLQTIEPSSKACHGCFHKLAEYYVPRSRSQPEAYDDTPDLSFFRKASSSHSKCIFGCKPANKLTVITPIRLRLLKVYQVYTTDDARLCSSHLRTENLWPLVKRITRPLPESEQFLATMLALESPRE